MLQSLSTTTGRSNAERRLTWLVLLPGLAAWSADFL